MKIKQKWDPIKLESFWEVRVIINKMKKKQPEEWEKIFANETTDKRLILKIYKQLMDLIIKKQTAQSKYSGQKI